MNQNEIPTPRTDEEIIPHGDLTMDYIDDNVFVKADFARKQEKQLTELRGLAEAMVKTIEWFRASIAEHNKHLPSIPACGYTFKTSQEEIAAKLADYQSFIARHNL